MHFCQQLCPSNDYLTFQLSGFPLHPQTDNVEFHLSSVFLRNSDNLEYLFLLITSLHTKPFELWKQLNCKTPLFSIDRT